MPHRRYGVSVKVQVNPWTVLERFEPVHRQDWNSTLAKAEDITTRLFPEDPMASRLFRAGVMVYTNVNDLGDRVVIEPVVRTDEDEEVTIN